MKAKALPFSRKGTECTVLSYWGSANSTAPWLHSDCLFTGKAVTAAQPAATESSLNISSFHMVHFLMAIAGTSLGKL